MAKNSNTFYIPNDIPKKFIELISRRAGRLVMRYFLKNYSNEGEESTNKFVRWKERKNLKNKNKLLVDTGSMKSGFQLKYRKNGFQVRNIQDYFKYHQNGTDNIPQRQMLYHNDQLDKIIIKEIDDVINRIFL